MDCPSIIAITPSLSPDPAVAIAACRAGALGILDAEFAVRTADMQAAVERLEQFAPGEFGIKIGADQTLLDAVLAAKSRRLRWVLLAGGDFCWIEEAARTLHEADLKVLCEAVSTEEAEQAAACGVDGIVLKGNESGGRVGHETAFILVQHWRQVSEARGLNGVPFWVQGGIGVNSAAACMVAGAAGVVLDNQLTLTREARLREDRRARVAAFDGSETVEVGRQLDAPFRVWGGPQSSLATELEAAAEEISQGDGELPARQFKWRAIVAEKARLAADSEPLLLCGQDTALARSLADRFVTVGGVIGEVRRRMASNRAAAARLAPLAAGSPLAKSHGTPYPLLQGPMTRVSDTAAFAFEVAEAGALPFLALALLRGAEAEKLIAETAEKLQTRPWGVGVLGFLPPEIRKEQTDAILKHRPPFAIIAGGRPDQAKHLEQAGIATYLHVPSPGLLRMFLKDGAKRFIFEGRECGGHVGPRSSFVLWETMCETLLEHLGARGDGSQLHVVFAGGIHDAVSSAMVACLSAPLAERGVKVGGLMGTAYLFTEEAVRSGAIVPRFQREALSASDTVLFETGPGHAVRCVRTPYFEAFNAEKARLRAEGRSHDEIVQTLEWMNVGRLRVASKGLDRASQGSQPGKIAPVSEDDQFARGMYMIGQVAAMRDAVTTMASLHEDVCARGAELVVAAAPQGDPEPAASQPCDVAIVGMSALYPGGISLNSYWETILRSRDAVTEVPPSHWDWRLYYDPDPAARDKIISKWGGFLSDVPFDPFNYGITPKSIPAIEPLQLLVLEGVRQALRDAGYERRPFDRENTCTVLGVGGGGSALAVSYGLRTCLPMFDTVEGLGVTSKELFEKVGPRLPEWTEDSFPGILLNVAAGRVANRFDFGGSNYALDAACASSLAAVHACIRELEQGTCNVAVAIGADTVQTPYAYVAFSKTHALSRRGRCAPFDADADGIVLSEGVGVVILKRLADAERDGDHIYAVIKGVGASSDGMDKGLTAPNSAGQMRAIRRAFAKAGFSPADVTLIEAHGTGTVVGDRTEATSLSQVMQESGAAPQSCAVGSVKSMIGHSKCAAGIAGLIKTAMALETKTLPPTRVEKPNPNVNFAASALYLNREPRPWVHETSRPRRAGVSAFGFGGTNVHVVLEEYRNDFVADPSPALREWPSELFAWESPSRPELAVTLDSLRQSLEQGARPKLAELAAAVCRGRRPGGGARLAIVANSLDDLQAKLRSAIGLVRGADEWAVDPRGVYFSATPAEETGKIAFLFPGQGSQYPNMLAQLAMNFDVAREALDDAQESLAGKLERPLAHFMYPPSPFGEEEEQATRQSLAATNVAQPAIGAASLAICGLLGELGLTADMVGGHSYGEFTALWAGGAFKADELLALSHLRGELIRQAAQQKGAGGMLAVSGDASVAESLAEGIAGVSLANINSPSQTVLSATEEALAQLIERAGERQIRVRRLPVSCAFHSPLVAAANDPLARRLEQTAVRPPGLPVFSNVTAGPYPDDPAEIRGLLARHLTSPVQFMGQVEAMYEAGARVFVEAGPNNVLTGLVGQILKDRPHLAVAMDVPSRDGLEQLTHAIGQLLARGARLNLEPLFKARDIKAIDLARLAEYTGEVRHSPSTWLVNGVRSRPVNGPEPRLIGTQAASVPDEAAKAASAASPAPKHTVAPGATATKSPSISPSSRTSPQQPPMAPSQQQQQFNQDPSQLLAASVNGQMASQHTGGAELPDPAVEVMLGFQNVMAKFLETQQAVMLSYLQAGGESAPQTPSVPALQTRHAAAPINNPPAPPVSGPAPYVPEEPVAEIEPRPLHAAANGQPETNGAASPAAAPVASNSQTSLVPSTAVNGHVDERFDIEKIGDQLLDLLSERTGYPKEMLDLDLDLEADLGIDSIKRVEILGGLTETLNGDGANLESKLDLEKLTSRRSLRRILEYLEEALAAESNGVSHSAPPMQLEDGRAPQQAPAGGNVIQRGLVQLVEAPLPPGAPSIPNGAVVLTDDGRGVARAIAERLADFGQPTAIVSMATGGQQNGHEYAVDLTDPAAVAALVKRLRAELGPIGGLVHALPLAPSDESTNLVARAVRDVKSLYVLARELESELRQAGEGGTAFLLAASGLGGQLGYGRRELDSPDAAAHGGIQGLLKCVGLEWPEVLVRSVDFDPTATPSDMADCLLRELADRKGPFEVGYCDATRCTWEPIAAPLPTSDDRERRVLPAGATVLVTGGARGITAEIAAALGEQYQPNLILVGRSPVPADEESGDTAGLSEVAAIKQALMARLEAEGRKPAPAEVEAAYRALIRDREVRDNIDRIRSTGANVEYHSVDVRDRESLAELISDVTRRFGRIDGVVHGAGVIEDKLLRDKTPESFDRVFGVKVESAFALSELLDFEELKFCVFFASIASRYGNRGQSDYAAANEVLSKLAIDLDRRWPGRVFSIAWGPWKDVGMVADLEPHLEARGVALIEPAVGAARFIEELEFGWKGESEVLIAGGAEHVTKPPARTLEQVDV